MATVDLLFFARLRESLGVERERLELPADVRTAAQLRDFLARRGESWARELAPSRVIRIAVNQDMVDGTHRIGDGDEIALFPPVTGG